METVGSPVFHSAKYTFLFITIANPLQRKACKSRKGWLHVGRGRLMKEARNEGSTVPLGFPRLDSTHRSHLCSEECRMCFPHSLSGCTPGSSHFQEKPRMCSSQTNHDTNFKPLQSCDVHTLPKGTEPSHLTILPNFPGLWGFNSSPFNYIETWIKGTELEENHEKGKEKAKEGRQTQAIRKKKWPPAHLKCKAFMTSNFQERLSRSWGFQVTFLIF